MRCLWVMSTRLLLKPPVLGWVRMYRVPGKGTEVFHGELRVTKDGRGVERDQGGGFLWALLYATQLRMYSDMSVPRIGPPSNWPAMEG